MSCDFEHPHPEHPCGRRVIAGVTRCPHCGNFDGSPECEAAGCWQPFTEADLDALYAEAWGIADPAAPDITPRAGPEEPPDLDGTQA